MADTDLKVLDETLRSGQDERLVSDRESIRDILSDPALPELLKEHEEDVRESLPYEFNLDRDLYGALEDRGLLISFSLRFEGRLIGYATFTVSPTLHCKGHTRALLDAVFVRKDCRGGLLGMHFLAQCCECLLPHFDTVWAFMPSHRKYGPMMKRIGFKETERVYVRRSKWVVVADH